MNRSKEWLHLFQTRLDEKNISPSEIDMVEDFAISLSVIRAFGNQPENPLVKMHLARAGHIIRHFTADNEK